VGIALRTTLSQPSGSNPLRVYPRSARGYVHAPTEPGLGYEIDWELIERNKVAVLS
jgi:L-alanine-DL-glutamate epimerase-like enolase superfamily enzyme